MELPRRLRFDGSDGVFPPTLRPVVSMGHWEAIGGSRATGAAAHAVAATRSTKNVEIKDL